MNKLFRINIFDMKGLRILSNRIPEPDHIHGEEKINRYDEVAPILKGETRELIIGLKNAEFSNEERFAVAVPRSFNRGAIVVNLDAASFLEFRKNIGIGKILQTMTKHHGIEYIILQDTIGILAASETIDTIDALVDSDFLKQALGRDSVYSRLLELSGTEIYEVVKRFEMDDEVIGIYRLGVSLDDVRNVEDRMLRRLIIISAILAAISIIVLSIIFTTQNLKTVSDEYKKFKTLASSVLENMSEPVIVTDNKKIITLFNKAAEQQFRINRNEAVGKNILNFRENILSLIPAHFSLNNKEPKYFEKEILINQTPKYLLFSLSYIVGEAKDAESFIIVIKDLTEIKHLEEEASKNEKLMAMGELASGVAHEIRNPINSIGMIAQRLNLEFTPSSNKSEYEDITNVLRNEVDRINRIVSQFLNYAKPLTLKLQDIDLKKFFDEIKYLFEGQAKLKNINFIIQSDESKNFRFDPDLIKQALMNIVQNALDAINKNGYLKLYYYQHIDNLVIEIKDNGRGIPGDIQRRIFDLYYTTKKEGNGLGLSIAQKIIAQHNGSIRLTSNVNEGTTFKIILPQQ
ncbi:MAG: PAS domain-containing protein [Ignavibacteriales bacterium]|nr:MAG: PAS domain-containing protein [Ignavibacteriales bacterium]